MSSHKFTHSIFTPNGRIVEEVKMGFEIPKNWAIQGEGTFPRNVPPQKINSLACLNQPKTHL